MATSEALNSIEQQLTEAAELQLTGTITEELYVSMVRGAIAVLPTPAAPQATFRCSSDCSNGSATS